MPGKHKKPHKPKKPKKPPKRKRRMTNWLIPLEFSVRFTARDTINEGQIRSFVASYRSDAETKLQALVAAAPSASQAVYNGTAFELQVWDEPTAGEWVMEFVLDLDVDTADTVTEIQVNDFLASYLDDGKAFVRAMMEEAPAGARVEILDWHIHRMTGPSDELEEL